MEASRRARAKKPVKTAILSMALATALSAAADDKRTISLTLENDSFFGTDRYYTQGTRLQYMHLPNHVPDWVGSSLTNFLTLGMGVKQTRMGGALSQELYTPSRLRPSAPILTDRPYAGHLHGSFILRRSGPFEGISGLSVQDEFEVNLGIVGPEALGKETQKWWHSMWDYIDPQGWGNQLKTEPAFQMFFDRAFRFGVETENFWGIECIPHVKAAVGTVYDYAEFGTTIRAGFNLPKDFVRSPLETYSTHPSDNPPDWSWYLFGGMDGRVVGHNMFLDGNNWRTSQSIDKELFVADFRGGMGVRYKSLEWVLSAVHRTREFKGQVADENFLSVTTQWHF
jgi:lipid A 3-O-deacylase